MAGVAKVKATIGKRILETKNTEDLLWALLRKSNQPASISAGALSEGISGEGAFLPIKGGTMKGPIAFFPKLLTIASGIIDITELTQTGYSSRIIISPESGSTDDLVTITTDGWPGQLLILQGVESDTITIKNSGNIETLDGLDFDLEDDDNILLIYDSTDTKWQQLTPGKQGLTGDPLILHEEDLGNITGSVNVDWSKANKFRGILVGNVTLSFINTPPNSGFVQQIILELKQDATGGRTVTFADSFENDHTPIIGKEPNEYNVWAFFASNRGTEPVFSFNTFQSTALLVAMSDEDSPLNFASTSVPAVSFRMPYPMIVTAVKASVRTATSGSGMTLDIHEAGTTILSTKITIDSGGTTSVGATPPVISDNELADDGLIELFMDSRDSGAAARGLKLTIFGYIS